VDATVNNYLAKGAPAEKLVMGVPFYGRSWKGVPATNNGLGQTATGAGPGTWEPGMIDYHDVVARYLSGGFTTHRDEVSKVPYLYNSTTGVFVTYDDPQSIAAKADYIRSKGLGGAMIWELSADTNDSTLLNSLNQGLG
jgi:chitinase